MYFELKGKVLHKESISSGLLSKGQQSTREKNINGLLEREKADRQARIQDIHVVNKSHGFVYLFSDQNEGRSLALKTCLICKANELKIRLS